MKQPEKPPVNSKEITLFTDKELLEFLSDEKNINQLYAIERENYPYWEEFRQRVKKFKVPADKLWFFLKYQRKLSSSYLLTIGGHTHLKFKYNLDSFLQESLHKFDLQGGGIIGGDFLPQENKNKLLVSSLMEEAIYSSILEGAVSTRDKAKEMLLKEKKPGTIDEQMIVNNYKTIQRLKDYKGEKLTKELILKIHSQITENTLKDKEDEGKYRSRDGVNVVDETGEVFYTPPSFTELDGLIQAVCSFANEDDGLEKKEFLHPVLKAIILHFLIGYIHPFADGNGRTARALFYWYLLKKGYWLSEYLSISRVIQKSKTQYAKAYLYTEYDENNLTYFMQYHLKCIGLAHKELLDYIDRKKKEKDALFDLVVSGKYNERQVDILQKYLTDDKFYTNIKSYQNRFAISDQTARNDLYDLAKRELLVMKLVKNKSVFFASDSLTKKLRVH